MVCEVAAILSRPQCVNKTKLNETMQLFMGYTVICLWHYQMCHCWIIHEGKSMQLLPISIMHRCFWHWLKQLPALSPRCSHYTPSSIKYAYGVIIPPLQRSWKGGILVSPCPSVHLWTESCLLCIFNNICRIHFMFAHLINQLQKVCCVQSLCQNSKIWNFGKFFKFLTLTCSSFDLGSNVNQ